jgi:hypothetical protein
VEDELNVLMDDDFPRVSGSSGTSDTDSMLNRGEGLELQFDLEDEWNQTFANQDIRVDVTWWDWLEDQFNDGTIDTKWTTSGATETDTCGSDSSPNALFFNSGGSTERFVETQDIDTTIDSPEIEFSLKYANSTNNCQDAVESSHNVTLQYSTDSGSSWTNISTYNATRIDQFTKITETMPTNAITASTRFRWKQFKHDDGSNWALDDVKIDERKFSVHVNNATTDGNGQISETVTVGEGWKDTYDGGSPGIAELENYSTEVHFRKNRSVGDVAAGNYCSSGDGGNDDDWITNVEFNEIDHDSGGDFDDGYEDFTSFGTPLEKGEEYSLTLTIGLKSSFEQHGRVWIDWDQDQQLTDETATDLGQCNTDGCRMSGTVSVPNDAESGPTLMRVSEKFDSDPSACESMDFGEVEDYAVKVIGNANSPLAGAYGFNDTQEERFDIDGNYYLDSDALSFATLLRDDTQRATGTFHNVRDENVPDNTNVTVNWYNPSDSIIYQDTRDTSSGTTNNFDQRLGNDDELGIWQLTYSIDNMDDGNKNNSLAETQGSTFELNQSILPRTVNVNPRGEWNKFIKAYNRGENITINGTLDHADDNVLRRKVPGGSDEDRTITVQIFNNTYGHAFDENTSVTVDSSDGSFDATIQLSQDLNDTYQSSQVNDSSEPLNYDIRFYDGTSDSSSVANGNDGNVTNRLDIDSRYYFDSDRDAFETVMRDDTQQINATFHNVRDVAVHDGANVTVRWYNPSNSKVYEETRDVGQGSASSGSGTTDNYDVRLGNDDELGTWEFRYVMDNTDTGNLNNSLPETTGDTFELNQTIVPKNIDIDETGQGETSNYFNRGENVTVAGTLEHAAGGALRRRVPQTSDEQRTITTQLFNNSYGTWYVENESVGVGVNDGSFAAELNISTALSGPHAMNDTYQSLTEGQSESTEYDVRFYDGTADSASAANGNDANVNDLFDVDSDYYFQSSRIWQTLLNRNDTNRFNATFHNVRDEAVPDSTDVNVTWVNPSLEDVYWGLRNTVNGDTNDFDQAFDKDDERGNWDIDYDIDEARADNLGNDESGTVASPFELNDTIFIDNLDIDIAGESTTKYFNRGETVRVTGNLKNARGDDFAQYKPDVTKNRSVKIELFLDSYGSSNVVSSLTEVDKEDGSFSVDIDLPTDLDDTYSSTTAGQQASTEYDVHVFDMVSTSTTDTQGDHGNQTNFFDVDSQYYSIVERIDDPPGQPEFNRLDSDLNVSYKMVGVRNNSIDIQEGRVLLEDPNSDVQHDQTISFDNGWLNLTEGDYTFTENDVTGLWDTRTKNPSGGVNGNTWNVRTSNPLRLTRWLNMSNAAIGTAYLNRGEESTVSGTLFNPYDGEAYTRNSGVTMRFEANGDTLSHTNDTSTDSNGDFLKETLMPQDAIDTYDSSDPDTGETKDYALNISTDGNTLNETQEKDNLLDGDANYYFNNDTRSSRVLLRSDTQRVNATFVNVRDVAVPDATNVTVRWYDEDDSQGSPTYEATRDTGQGSASPGSGRTNNVDQQFANTDAPGTWRFKYRINRTDTGNLNNSLSETNGSRFALSDRIAGKSSSQLLHLPFATGFNDTVYDLSGKNQDGSFAGSPNWTDGKYDKALVFDGDNDYVTVPDSSRLDQVFGGSRRFNFTFTSWVKVAEWEDWATILNKAESGWRSATTAGIWVEDQGIVAVIGSNECCNNAGSSIRVSHKPSLDEWHHVTAKANGSHLFLYIDGEQKGKQAITDYIKANLTSNDEPVTIGRRSESSSPSINGTIDELRIYDTSFTDEEIRREYQSEMTSLSDVRVNVNGEDATQPKYFHRGETLDINGTLLHPDGKALRQKSPGGSSGRTIRLQVFNGSYGDADSTYEDTSVDIDTSTGGFDAQVSLDSTAADTYDSTTADRAAEDLSYDVRFYDDTTDQSSDANGNNGNLTEKFDVDSEYYSTGGAEIPDQEFNRGDSDVNVSYHYVNVRDEDVTINEGTIHFLNSIPSLQFQQTYSFDQGWINSTGDYTFADDDDATAFWDTEANNTGGASTDGNTFQTVTSQAFRLTQWLNISNVRTESLDYLNRQEDVTLKGDSVENPFDGEAYDDRSITLRLEARGDDESFTASSSTDGNGDFSQTKTIPTTAFDTYASTSPASGEGLNYSVNLTSSGNVLNATQQADHVFDVDSNYYLSSSSRDYPILMRDDTQRVQATFVNVRDENVPDNTEVRVQLENPSSQVTHTTTQTTSSGQISAFDKQFPNDNETGVWRAQYQIDGEKSANDGNSLGETTPDRFQLSKHIYAQSTEQQLYLPFEEGFGTTAYDRSGKDNDGTVNGAKWENSSAAIGEVGTFTTAGGAWANVSFEHRYDNPVVVGTTNTHDGNAGLVFEARNINARWAEMRVCESRGSNSVEGCDNHGRESVGYVVIDASRLSGVGGAEAGTFDVSGEIDSTTISESYDTSFGDKPVVLFAPQTHTGEGPIEAWPISTSDTGFTAGICEQTTDNSCNASHPTETVGWVALEPDNLPFDQQAEVDNLTASGGGIWQDISFSRALRRRLWS